LATPVTQSALDPVDFRPVTRELCQHLALARDRQYSAELIERLSRLALAGHANVLYGAHSRAATRMRGFILAASLRQSGGSGAACCWQFCFFFGPLLAVGGALQRYPDFA
jgi:hypothetical protein